MHLEEIDCIIKIKQNEIDKFNFQNIGIFILYNL
jgi:hypothetical protein